MLVHAAAVVFPRGSSSGGSASPFFLAPVHTVYVPVVLLSELQQRIDCIASVQ